MQKITPFLWFNDNAEEAVDHYVAIFKNSKILRTTRGPHGKPAVIAFQLEGQDFIALNGGPHFQFTEAISLHVGCETQDEVDALWARLTEGGQPGRCGWLKDKFGLSWQVIPTTLGDLLYDPDPVRAARVMQAMLQMDRLDLAALHRAHAAD
jgi:predicted 3-demethylubiquinone-9 3-methyltransferase (glyoxalase superfamily)